MTGNYRPGKRSRQVETIWLERFGKAPAPPKELEPPVGASYHRQMTEKDALALFDIPNALNQLHPVESGLIHSTYSVHDAAGTPQLILQKIKTTVFADVVTLERNMAVVTGRLKDAAEARGLDPVHTVLTFVPARDGRLIARDEQGGSWRLSRFIANSVAVDVAEDPELTGRIAGAFAWFHRDLWEVPAGSITAVIPDFHNTPLRCERLRDVARSLSKDSDAGFAERLANSSVELQTILDRSVDLGRIQNGLSDGTLTASICHNDTKVNNVLLDRDSMMPLCVIDLDTVGPGSVLADVGDMLRTAAASVSEEERDLSKVRIDTGRAEAVVDGFLSVLGDHLNETERRMLFYSGWLITMEQAIRYLTDYLEGDVYYGERYPGHNLVRTRNQLALAQSMESVFNVI